LLFTGFDAPHRHTITLQFKHHVGDRDLHLFTGTYVNQFGEPFTITRFKYYIAHISITGPDGKPHVLSNKTWLIDEADSASKTLTFTTDVTAPQQLSFVMGVDSVLNVSGVQTGDLDPLKGMFWTWNSGYIVARLEGRSDSSHAPGHYVTWDVGGFRSPANAARTIQLSIPAGTAAVSQVLVVHANLLAWFNAIHPVKISQQPLCHQPGKLAMQLADNYAAMFAVTL
jgi:hypothetical protein